MSWGRLARRASRTDELCQDLVLLALELQENMLLSFDATQLGQLCGAVRENSRRVCNWCSDHLDFYGNIQ